MHCIYPRKGTETCGNPPKPPGNRLQFIPVRGRKPVRTIQLFAILADCNLSPRGGEDAFPLLFTFAKLAISVSPREGTETALPLRQCQNTRRLQFIPVRGRKPVRTIQLFAILADCNLSPRGGEDAFPLLFTFAKLAISVSPREGTETALPLRQCQNTRRLQFIPVRGRKLTTHGANAQTATLQFIPARGRKRHCSHDNIPILRLQLIPARGQKSTSATGVCQQRRCFAFSYILFYRLKAAPAGIVFVTGSALTPCGASGFMGRISCR